jgi:hypothetical protein
MANFTITIPDTLIAQLPAALTVAKARAALMAHLREQALRAYEAQQVDAATALVDAKRAELQAIV